jgi:branched-chain amino acid transport system ATP-binding protein
MLFEVKDLSVHYDKVAALKGVSLDIAEGELIALLGSNGAGKTTLLKTVSGLKIPTSGEIWFDGNRVDKCPPHEVVNLGIAHVPEGRRVFPYMSVFENLKMGTFRRKDRQEIAKDYEMVYTHFPRLRERRTQYAISLSGGEQQMLATARALMARPRLLLLDEPSLGLSPIMCREIARVLTEIRKTLGVSILLVEQNAQLALELCDRAYILRTGEIAIQGSPQRLKNNHEVKRAYLGM